MGVMCQIYIRKSRDGVHRPGERVSGIVRYAVDEATEYKNITISFIGKARAHWSESTTTTNSDGSSSTSTTSYTGHEEYMRQHLNVLNKGPNETVTIPVGCYEFPFEFNLPNTPLPPSYHDSNCDIRYYVKMVFEKASFFSFNKKFEKDLIVYGYVHPTAPLEPVIYGLRKELAKLFSSKKHVINLKAEILKSAVTPGENINLEFHVTNDTDVEIKSIKVELIDERVYKANCGKTKHHSKVIQAVTVETPHIKADSLAKLRGIVATLPELYSIQHCRVFDKQYKIRVTVRIPFPHTNPSVNIPVVIGEMFSDVRVDLEALDETDDAPPTYWEAMAEGETKNHK